MSILTDVELGRLVRQMPVGLTLRRAAGGYWVTDYQGARYIHSTPEAVLRPMLESLESEPVSREGWLEDGGASPMEVMG